MYFGYVCMCIDSVENVFLTVSFSLKTWRDGVVSSRDKGLQVGRQLTRSGQAQPLCGGSGHDFGVQSMHCGLRQA